MVKFVADSSSDLLTLPGAAFQSAPLTISTESESFRDDETIDIPGMIDCLANYKGRSFTACPSVDDWMQAYMGADCVYVGVMTSNLSGSYNSAMAARELFLQSHPDVKIHVFDTLSTGPELRLLMEKLAELDSQGLSFEEVVEKATEYQKHTRLFFSLQSLNNLAQNGRVSKIVSTAVGVLGIRVVGTASEVGTLQPISKVRGDKKALPELMKLIEEAGYKGGKIRISNIQNPALGDQFAAMVKAAYPTADIVTYSARGLCSYYAEQGAIMIGIETE